MQQDRPILIVDDDQDARELLAEAVGRDGFTTMMAEDGRDAIEQLRTCTVKPCLILMDLSMPEMDGYELRREQCADPETATIPTVVVSANFDQCDRARLAGVEILPKPVSLDQVRNIVLHHCHSGASAS